MQTGSSPNVSFRLISGFNLRYTYPGVREDILGVRQTYYVVCEIEKKKKYYFMMNTE
jgi:hypothetical protein